MNPEEITIAVAKKAFSELTKVELAAINLAVAANFDPRGVLGYEKVKHLFTLSGGTEMHALIKQALAEVVESTDWTGD